jgi:hypothetical protein
MLIVVRTPRYKLFFLFILSVVMVAASAWLAFGSPWTMLLLKGLGLFATCFFGICGGWVLSRLFSHRISIILDRNGLVDNSSALPGGRIPWDQITRVGITKVSDRQFLGIDVEDRSLLAASRSAFRRWIDDYNVAITGYPVNIPSTTIDRTLEELQALIVRYWQEPKARTELDAFDR